MTEAGQNGRGVIAVTGVTGRMGGAVARRALQAGFRVRGLVRSPGGTRASPWRDRIEMLEGDFEDPESLRQLCSNVNGLFAMSTPYEAGAEAEEKQGLALLRAAEEARVPHVVLGSVAHATKHTKIPHFESKAELERFLRASKLSYSIVAPVSFMENWLAPWFVPALRTGTVAMAVPTDRRILHVSVEDVAQVVVAMLSEPEAFRSTRIELATEPLSPQDVANVLTGELGRTFQAQSVPLEVIEEQSHDLACLFKWFAEFGYEVDVQRVKERFPTQKWVGFREWVRKQDWTVLDHPS